MKKTALTLTLVFALLISLMIIVQSAESSSKTIVVPDDYPTIQEAIDSASAGDTVFVKNGVYTEKIRIDKSLSLIGEDRQNTVVIGVTTRFSASYAVRVTAEDVTISGFTIKDDHTGDRKIGIWVDTENYQFQPSRCRIIGNNIENNRIEGIVIQSGENHVISENNITRNKKGISVGSSNNVISGNNIRGNNALGVSVVSSTNVTISENNISGNGVTPSYGETNPGGLNLRSYGSFFVYGNNITDNQGFGVQFAEGCSNSLVYQNNILRNGIGVKLLNFPLGGDSTIGTGNIVYLNNIVDNSQQAFVERGWSGNSEQGNGTDVVAWDNSEEGNYWSDYLSSYPNAAEVAASGIGDTPYVVDENGVDHYPLMQQVDISTASPPPSTPLSFLTALIAGAAITLVVVGVVLLIHFKKRKH